MPQKWSISSSETSAGTKTLQKANMASLLSTDGFVCEIAVSTKATHLSSCNCNDEEVVLLSTAVILIILLQANSGVTDDLNPMALQV